MMLQPFQTREKTARLGRAVRALQQYDQIQVKDHMNPHIFLKKKAQTH
jgi:hypothetical protein